MEIVNSQKKPHNDNNNNNNHNDSYNDDDDNGNDHASTYKHGLAPLRCARYTLVIKQTL